MRWKRPAVAVSVAALLTLAACGGDGGSSAPETTETFIEGGGAGQAIDPTRIEGPAPAIEGATEGGDVTVLSASGLTTMDPTEAYYVNTYSILSGLVVRSLTQYVYDPESEGMVLIPDLATKWVSNDDFTEWTFTIREGVRYENGDEVTPDDVVYGLLRSMDRKTFAGGADYSNQYFKGGLKYEGPITSGSTDFPGITVSGQDVTIKMSKPFPDMPYWGAFPTISAIPEKASDPKDYALHPLATGPYMFDEYEPGTSLSLVRNTEWDPATDPGRHAYPESYDMTFSDDSSQLDQLILNDQGNAQTTLTYDNLLTPDYRTARNEAQDRLVLGSAPCTFYQALEWDEITDPLVREAIAWAYPYEDNWLAIGEVVGVTRVPGTTILPPGIPGREVYDAIGTEGQVTDVDKARALLEEAGEVGYELRYLYYTDDPNSVAGQKEVTKSYEAAGFTAKPVATTLAEGPTQRSDPDFPINVRGGGWCSDWPTGSSWMPPLFQSDGSTNYGSFNEPAVDEEILRIQSEVPIEDQPAEWATLDQTIMEEYQPWVITGYSGVAMLHGSKIDGMLNDDVAGMPTWKDISLIQ